MNEKNNFALVPRPTDAIEKTQLGAKRLLSAIVADTLALVRVESHLEQWCLFGESCHFGIGRKCDSTEAVKWFRMAAEKGHARAQCWLGFCYQRECGVKKDMVEGARCFQAAAKQGEATAHYNLGVCFEGGLGVPADRENMIACYERSADRGHAGAQYRLGVCSLAGNEGKGLVWLERAAEQGHTKAQLNLALLFYPSDRSVAEAVYWYRKAAESGSTEAEAALGRCYELGRGVPQDVQEAVRLFQSAAKKGDKHGQYNLGSCFADGKGVIPDPLEASKWFRQAAEQGCEEALFEIGKRYERGEGVPQNFNEADRWLRKAAECEEYPEAQRYLALRFTREGNLEEAWAYFRLAAEEGKDQSAQEELNRLRPLMTQEQMARGEERFSRLLERHSWKRKCGVYDLETPVQQPRRSTDLTRPRCNRSLRIVVLDDEPFVGEALQMMLRFDLPDSFILTFTDAAAALQELEREGPDLFTTDINHVGMRFPEILDRLADRRGKFPVFVLSAWAESDTAKEMVKRCKDEGWNVTLLSKPFLLDDLRRPLSLHLGLDYPELGNSGR